MQRQKNKNNELELVVLVDEQDRELGVMEKSKVHHAKTPLHRGLSVFLFDKAGRVLVQQRATTKNTWPGVWSNSCCGHPLPGETDINAVKRCVKYELGLKIDDLRKITDYRYKFERDGVVENEVCPIYTGVGVGVIRPNPKEVKDYKWMEWEDLLKTLKADKSGVWSEWCKEEAVLVGLAA